MRATLRLSSPAWFAQPRMTSVTRDGSSFGLRCISSAMTMRGQVVGAHLAQPAADVADGRANAVDDICVGHVWIR